MFILIHGAYHAGWCFARIQEGLSDAGQATHCPDLPGHGGNGWLADQTLPAYAKHVVSLLDAASEPAVLVGHSLGGATALMVAAERPEKVAKIIFLTAYIPKSGESVGDLVAQDTACFAQVNRVEMGDILAIGIRAASLKDAFYNDADARTLSTAQDRVQFQSPDPFRQTLEYKDLEGIPKAAIICTKDRAISPGHQRFMAERIACDPIIELDAGHSPFLTAPDALTKALLELGRV